MKLRIASLSFLLICLAGVPAVADTIYNNGPINGTTDAWTVNFGFVVSDTFTIPAGGGTITGLNFGAWMFPGDDIHIGDVFITSSEFGGTTYFDGTINFTVSDCSTNQYGYSVCTESGRLGPVNLAGGTYWLSLENFEDVGDPLYWDENSGPSQASENTIGTIPSEAFTLLGTSSTTTTSSTSVPEPNSVMLFGSGILGLAGMLRRRWL